MATKIAFKYIDNTDTGSIKIGSELPAEFRTHAIVPANLSVQFAGEQAPRKITYVMGSEKKGFHLCSKGSGPFPTGDGEATLIVED